MTGSTPRFRWVLPEVDRPSLDFANAGEARGLSSRALGILWARGHRDGHALRALFDAPASGLHDPRLLPAAEAFAARIRAARARRERVLVFGDFDADGLTGLAIVVRTLRSLGLDAAPHVPDRVDEGHGLSKAAIERCVTEGRTLIVTVDCGTSSVAEVAGAAELGIDVLISDHHRPPAILPRAVAIVNPHLPGSTYPDPRLAGSGVAFKLAQLLFADDGHDPERALALADFAAVGAIADMVPIVGENRAIVRLGLAQLRTEPRPAFAALLRESGMAPERVGIDAIGYSLAPRLNAVGRVGDGASAAALLLTDDPAEADGHAAALQAANLLRRDLTAVALAEARAVAASDDGPAVVLLGDWPVGIIGLVAGRLAEDLGRPVVIISRAAQPWRGSARSPAGFDLAEAFQACGDLFERHGGHAAAAGCTILPEHLPAMRERFLALAAGFTRLDPRPELRLDLVAEANAVDYTLFRELAPLETTGDPPPVLGIHGLLVARVRAANGGHLQLTLKRGREVLDGICFGRAEELGSEIHEGQAVDIAARVTSRAFGGFESLQLEIRDVAPAGSLEARMMAA